MTTALAGNVTHGTGVGGRGGGLGEQCAMEYILSYSCSNIEKIIQKHPCYHQRRHLRY